MKELYFYEGPVTNFGRCVMNKYKAYTYASSEKQAENNIKVKWKKEHGYLPTYKVELPYKIRKVEPKGEYND